MTKRASLIIALCVVAVTAHAQKAIYESRNTDNLYIGLHGGVQAKTTHTKADGNLNPQAGLRIGRWFTPVVGLAVEGEAHFRNHPYCPTGTFVRTSNVGLVGTLNLSNWLGGYPGRPRRVELIGVGGLGWLHNYATASNVCRLHGRNYMTSKVALDLALNLGSSRAWQLYLEPQLNYSIAGAGTTVQYNINRSTYGVSLGLNYKFGNSNGTHNFRYAQLRDQAEIDALNRQIADLRQDVSDKDSEIAHDGQLIAELRSQLEAERQKKPSPTIVKNVTKVVQNNVLQPTIIFGQGRSTVDAAQMASVAMVAKYLKNHPQSHLLIKGYASPEGNPELNQRLSEARAQSVKDALVSRYGISASRLSVQGMGATDELFDEIDFNRVATFTDTTK